MQFIRRPKPRDIAERELPALVADWVDTYSVQSINIVVLQQLQVNMLVSWVIEWSKSGMPHWHTFRHFAHQTWAIWDLSNHDLIRIISDPGSKQHVTLSLESICTIPSQAGASDVKMPKLRPQSSNRGMPCFVYVFGTFRGTWDQAYENPNALFRCTADICSNITYREIERPRMLIAGRICPLSLVGCTNDWHNRRSGRKLIVCIPPPIAYVHLALYSTALRVSEVHRFKIKVCLKWKMC